LIFEHIAILFIVGMTGAAFVGPLGGYLLGLWRCARRSPQAIAYYVSQHRSLVVSFYKATGLSLAGLLAGKLISLAATGVAPGIAGLAPLAPAAILLVAMVPVGLSIGPQFVLASNEPTPGCCAKCDYDLRGSPETRCPECGHGEPTFGARR